MTNSYSEYKLKASSEKITLAIMDGSVRLVAWLNHSENIYKKQIKLSVIESIVVNSKPYQRVNSILDLVDSSYFYDSDTEELYIYHLNPNSRSVFIAVTQKYFFSSKALSLPSDLSSGTEVYFEPLIRSTSGFGVELDVVSESLSAIEGSGTLTLHNDFDFWTKNFSKINFDNQLCEIYSYASELEPSQAKLIYRGFIESKSYDSNSISFKLKDLLYALRNSINFKNVSELGYRNKLSFNEAKQRKIYGRVLGFRPTNLDSLIDNSYPIEGTVSFFYNSSTLVGTGTRFLTQLIPGDKLKYNNAQYTIKSISSDETLTLTSVFNAASVGNLSVEVVPKASKSYINRKWLLSEHSLSQPKSTIQAGTTTSRLVLSSTRDIYDGDSLWIGGENGELVTVSKVINDSVVTLLTSTERVWPIDTEVYRPCVQNLRMNDLKLIYKEDYEVDSNAGILTIFEIAELNRSALIESTQYITCVNGSSVFTGVETNFSSYLAPGNKVRPKDTDDWYTVADVSDTEITLTSPYLGETFGTSEPMPEITTISGLSNHKEVVRLRIFSTDGLHGSYFIVYTKSGSVAVWFDVGNIGLPEPAHNCDTSIEVSSINEGDTENTIHAKIAQRINREEEVSARLLNNYLYIYQSETGVRPSPKDSDIDDVIVSNLDYDLQRITFVGDVGNSLDNTLIYIYDNLGLVYLWFTTNSNSNGNPAPVLVSGRYLNIDVSTDDDATTVRAKTKAVLDLDGYFSSTNFGSNQLDLSGPIITANSGTLSGSEFQVFQTGKSAHWLQNKYFIIPYFDSVSKSACFWFNVDGLGVAPSVVADSIKSILIDSVFTESEIFEAINAAATDLGFWTVDYTDSSISFTDNNNHELSTTLSVGNSELTIKQAQAGVSSNPFAGKLLQYKNFIFSDSSDVLSCDIYGKTNNSGYMLKNAAEIVHDLIFDSGLGSFSDNESFDNANNFFSEEIAFCLPDSFSSTSTNLKYRDVINKINSGVFGILLQSNDFKLSYSSIRPQSSSSMIYLQESDVLDLNIDSSSSNVSLNCTVNYGFKEYNFLSKDEQFISNVTKTSEEVRNLAKKSTSTSFDTFLVNYVDAKRCAGRWSFLLENAENKITITTKLQAIDMQVGDIFQLEHRKLPLRFSSNSKTRLLMVQSIEKTSNGVKIESVDLSNALNRISKISNITTSWSDSNEDSKLTSGFITDNNGLIGNDEASFFTNLIW